MADIRELHKAIAAHSAWKGRLMIAVDTGRFDTPLEIVRQDNQCAFGKWLHGPTLSASDRASSHFKSVKALHANFHETAARVVELALAGKKMEAHNLLTLVDGEYVMISTKLTLAMVEWRKASQ